MPDEKGVWRTIRGNHIFIKEGQTVEEAFKEHLEKVKSGAEKPNKEKFALKEKQKYGKIELERRPESAEKFEDVDVKKQVRAIEKVLNKSLGKGNYEVFAHGSGKAFQMPSDLFGFSGEGAQVHGVGIYTLVDKWEKSKDYAKKAFARALTAMEIGGVNRDFVGYSDKEIEDIADTLDKVVKSRKKAFESHADENRWTISTALSADMGEYGVAKTRAMQEFVAKMYKNDFANYDEFKAGLKRTIEDIKKENIQAKEALKRVKPQIMVGVVPPDTKKRLIVAGDEREYLTLIKDQTPEVQESVKRIINAIPPYHYDYYEIDGEKYLYTPDTMFLTVSKFDPKQNRFVATGVESKAKQTELEEKIKAMGKPTGTLEIKVEKYDEDMTYADLLKIINRNWGGDDKTLTKKMAEYGIYGLRYHGRVDGDCIVQFDPSKFDVLTRNVDGEWRDVTGGMTAQEKTELRKSEPFKRFEDKVLAQTKDISHYHIAGLEVVTETPEVRINSKGGLSSYIDMKYTSKSGEVHKFKIRMSDHAKHTPDKTGQTQIYQNTDDWQVNGRSLEEKLKEKVAQIEKLGKGEKLPVEKNTTSDSFKWSKRWKK